MPRNLAALLVVASILATLLGGGRSPGGQEAPAAAAAPASLDVEREIFFAVLEGLYEDGVDDAAVDRVLEMDAKSGWPANFVYSCPICMPAFDAWRSYRHRQPFFGRKIPADNFGPGLDEALQKTILEGSPEARRQVISDLMKRWVETRMRRLRLDDREKAVFATAIQVGMKQGRMFLESYRNSGAVPSYEAMKDCPLCVGAERALGSK